MKHGAEVSTTSPDHWLENPLDIGSSLNDLLRSADYLEIVRSEEESSLPAYIAAVSMRGRTFRFRAYQGEVRLRELHSETVRFRGSANGVRMAFTVNGIKALTEIADEDGEQVIFEAAFPLQLYRLQRRAYFRVRVHSTKTSVATWAGAPAGERIHIQDVSLAGVGLRSTLASDALPEAGEELQDVQLDFGQYGSFRAHLKLVNKYEVKAFDVTLGPLTYTHLGCVFAHPDARRDNFLQKLVYQLELLHRG